MSETHDRPGSINQRPGIPVLPPNGTSKSRLKAGLLAGAAGVALYCGHRSFDPRRIASAQERDCHEHGRAASANGQMPGFADLVATVKPAVVSVRVKADITPQLMANDYEARPFQGAPFEKFFREFGGKAMPGQRGAWPPRVRARAGLRFLRQPGWLHRHEPSCRRQGGEGSNRHRQWLDARRQGHWH